MSIKIHELTRLGLEPFLLPLYRQIRLRLKNSVKFHSAPPSILDVGGRKSPYTIGLRAEVTIIDLPRESNVQQKLNLGINDTIVDQLKKKRSNIKETTFGDMTCSGLPSESFDYVVSVEVLEHVEEDDLFVSEVSRVLKPNGKFIMTTPNGDWVENKNPDHKRHYKKKELSELLSKYFERVTVDYAIVGGKYRKMGLRAWSFKRPVKTALSMFGNVVNAAQSANSELKHKAEGTYHLIAVAEKN